MDTAFSWLGQLMEWLGNLIPRVRIVRATHGGVKFRCGKRIQEIKPGLCIYWPLVTEVDVIPVARQTHNLPTQCLLTKDGKQIAVGVIVVYSICDVVRALSANWDFNDTISDITLTATAQVVASNDFEIIAHDHDKIEKLLTQVTRKKLRAYGVRVYRTAFTDFAVCKVVKLLGEGYNHG